MNDSVEYEVRATGNDWDAPVLIRYAPDGSIGSIAREVPPGPLPGACIVWPHAVIYADGVLTPFDAARQPPITGETPFLRDDGRL